MADALLPRFRALALASVALASAALVTACGSSAPTDSEAELTAVATTTHVADLVRNVGGDRVEVHQFLTAGADPHGYEARPSDARAVAEATVLFQSGGDLDAWLGGLVENAGGDAETVTLLDAVRGSADQAGDVSDDPHWWQNPRNAIAAVDAITRALTEADPEGARIYERNAAAYERRLERLDVEIERCMQRIPDRRRKLVTTHDSYGHFAERYDVEVVGALIPSRSSQAQPSTGETAALIEQIEEEGVEAIFPESAPGPELEEAVAREAGAVVGDSLWADSLGPEGSTGETYVEALAADAEALAEGFGGGEAGCRIATE